MRTAFVFFVLVAINNAVFFGLVRREAKQEHLQVVEKQAKHEDIMKVIVDGNKRIEKQLEIVDRKLDRRIGDGPNTGEAPK